MNQLQTFLYQNSPIQFETIEGEIFANATAMCKPFGKRPDDIFKTKAWLEFEQAVCDDLGKRYEDIRYARQGGVSNEQGTWIHQELILELARRLDPRLAVWCNRRIAELVRTGRVEIKEFSRKELALMVIHAEEEKERLALENQHLKELREADQSKVDFYEAVTSSQDVADLGTVAKLLNIPGIGRTKLFAELRTRKVLMLNNRPYQEYVDRGWFRVIETSWSKPDGSQHTYFKTVVYQRGVDGIRKLLTNEGKRSTLPVTTYSHLQS